MSSLNSLLSIFNYVRKRTSCSNNTKFENPVPLCLITCVYFLFAFSFFNRVLLFYSRFTFSIFVLLFHLRFTFLFAFCFFICVLLFHLCFVFFVLRNKTSTTLGRRLLQKQILERRVRMFRSAKRDDLPSLCMRFQLYVSLFSFLNLSFLFLICVFLFLIFVFFFVCV